jgi:hypothetical protein
MAIPGNALGSLKTSVSAQFIPYLDTDSTHKIQKVIGYFQKVIGRSG